MRLGPPEVSAGCPISVQRILSTMSGQSLTLSWPREVPVFPPAPVGWPLPGSRPWPNSVDSPLAHLQLNVQPATQGLPYRLLGSFSLSLSPLTIYPTNSTSHPQVALFPQLFLGSPLCLVFQKVSLVGHTSLSSLLSGVMAMSEIVASYTFVFWLS